MHYRYSTQPRAQALVVALLTLVLGGFGSGCDESSTEPEDPRITALWEDPSACGAAPYQWLRDPTIGTVVEWEENELFDYNPAMLEAALSASGFRIEKEFVHDELVDTPIERDSFDSLCARGFALEYLECAGADHVGGAVGSLAEQIDFLAARRRGDPWPAEVPCVRTPPVLCSGTDVP